MLEKGSKTSWLEPWYKGKVLRRNGMLNKKAIKEELVRERQPIGRRQLSHENDMNSRNRSHLGD